MRRQIKLIYFLGALICAISLAYGFVHIGKQSSPLVVKMKVPEVFSESGLTALPEELGIENPEKIKLGLALFKDKRLSKNNSTSCNSCHNLSGNGADGKDFSTGIENQIGTANAPTVFNVKFNFKFFWDGRAATLADQVEGPIHNPKEMGSGWPEITAKLTKDGDYQAIFKKIYGQGPTHASIVDALVTFENSLTTPDAPFDRYLRGEKSAMSREQLSGFRKFQSYGCIACHQGTNIGGNMFQTLGVMGDYFSKRGGTYESDLGRFGVTHEASDLHVFRVPSLRNVALTGPYFHDGQVKTLDEAVTLMGRYQLGREIPLVDRSELVSFLKSLTGERPKSLITEREVANEKTN